MKAHVQFVSVKSANLFDVAMNIPFLENEPLAPLVLIAALGPPPPSPQPPSSPPSLSRAPSVTRLKSFTLHGGQ